jgi:UDP-N-acetylglucosamine 2-epimerase (non-hydrolysing)
VFTLNRKALLASKDNLLLMLQAVARVAGDVPVIAPLRGLAAETVQVMMVKHPELQAAIRIVPALGYLEFGYLTSRAKGIITDSGNVAEEATFNHVPCITLNSYTEHQETVKQGTNVLVGEDAERLASEVGRMLSDDWVTGQLPDRWDGRTAERIVSMLCA